LFFKVKVRDEKTRIVGDYVVVVLVVVVVVISLVVVVPVEWPSI